jgi:hypothetical protein
MRIGDSFAIFRRSSSAIICGDSGCSERNVGPGPSVSQPASAIATASAADARSGRTRDRRFKRETPRLIGFPQAIIE